MAREKKRKTLVYKHSVLFQPGQDLKSLLAAALELRKTVGSRRESLAPAGESPIWRLIGQFRVESQFVFGVLMRYMPGTNPAFVVDDALAETLTVQQLSAPATDEGKKRELVEGMLFFGVLDDHLVMMQSTALRSDHLETHLQWLLHDAGVLESTNGLQLIDQLPKHARETLAEKGVRSLDIGGALMPSTGAAMHALVPAPEEPTSSPAIESITVTEATSSMGVLETLKSLMAPDKAAKLNLDALAGSNIEYTLRIRYKYSTTDDGQRLMDTLGSALRHAEGVQTRIGLVGGGSLEGDELRLSGPVMVDTYDGIPAADEVFEVMRAWLIDKVKSGEVKAS